MFKRVNKHERLREATSPFFITTVAASPRGDIVACSDGRDLWMQQGEGNVTRRLLNTASDTSVMAFSGDGEYLIHSSHSVNMHMSTTRIISLASGLSRMLQCKDRICRIFVDKCSEDVIIRTDINRSFHTTTKHLSTIDDVQFEAGLAAGLKVDICKFSDDKSVIWYSDPSSRFHAHDLQTGKLRSSDLNYYSLSDIAECGDGLYALHFDGHVAGIDKTTLKSIRSTHHGFGYDARLVTLGQSLFVDDADGLCAVDFNDETCPPPSIPAARSFAPSFDGKHIYARAGQNKTDFVAYEIDDFDPDVEFAGIKSAAKTS